MSNQQNQYKYGSGNGRSKSKYNQRNNNNSNSKNVNYCPVQNAESLQKESELKSLQELEDAFKFESKNIEIKTFPQHKIILEELDVDYRDKFQQFYSKLSDPQNAFTELFRKDLRI